jgi:hypothetical protein
MMLDTYIGILEFILRLLKRCVMFATRPNNLLTVNYAEYQFVRQSVQYVCPPITEPRKKPNAHRWITSVCVCVCHVCVCAPAPRKDR